VEDKGGEIPLPCILEPHELSDVLTSPAEAMVASENGKAACP
jgi:hypothetical protein